jgi:uncharacterized membrane protein
MLAIGMCHRQHRDLMTTTDDTGHSHGAPAPGTTLTTARLEAFSDGVFAIAITLLVLDLNVPDRGRGDGAGLASALAHEWPAYFAYVVSFFVIGIIWVNHHALCTLARRVDRRVLFANLFLLLAVSVIPFPTRLISTYLTAGGADAHTAAAVYSATMLLMGLAFATLFLTITRSDRLLHKPLPPVLRRSMFRRFTVGTVFYLVTVALSFVSAPITLLVHELLAVYYSVDQLRVVGD